MSQLELFVQAQRFAFDRRTLLTALLGLAGLKSGRTQTPVDKTVTYRSLREPVTVAAPKELWASMPFTAWLATREGDDISVPALLLNGIAVRIPNEYSGSGELQAFCTLCPHEFCYIDYLVESNLVVMDTGVPPDHPLFFCGCHFSVFNPLTGGNVISGPAERAMFRFGFEIQSDMMYITKVEEGVLTLLRGLL